MVTAERARELLSMHGVVQPQPPDEFLMRRPWQVRRSRTRTVAFGPKIASRRWLTCGDCSARRWKQNPSSEHWAGDEAAGPTTGLALFLSVCYGMPM